MYSVTDMQFVCLHRDCLLIDYANGGLEERCIVGGEDCLLLIYRYQFWWREILLLVGQAHTHINTTMSLHLIRLSPLTACLTTAWFSMS